MNLEIKIIKDNDVFDLLNDKDFILQWEKLADQNEKVTVIQERPFVLTWYSQYCNKYQPILILGFDDNSNMVGLMPLAYSLKNNYLVHAGDGQAEYHGWLSNKEADQDFPIQAMIAVKRHFKLRKWQWRPMPPRSQINWLYSDELKRNGIYIKIHEENSPVLDLNDEDKINKIRKNKSTQIKLNRYKKRNGFYIERIKSKEKAKQIFDILAAQCDFRQMARHESAPFGRDENKKQFYIERLNFPENNHFTVMWSDNIPIAFHFGACDSDTVYWGLSSYNPLEEKNSPGSILIVKMIELLKEEGYRYFDVTPGGAQFKEKYSSFHQKILTPAIYFIKRDKIIVDVKHFVRQTIKKIFISTGIKPQIIKDKLEKISEGLKEISTLPPKEIITKLFSVFYKKDVYVLFRYLIDDKVKNYLQNNEIINVNKYSDLLLYNNSNVGIRSRSDLFSMALKHFASEDLLYSTVLNGVLAQYAWMARGGKSHRLESVGMEFNSPEGSSFLFDFFTEPNSSKKELCAKTLEKMLSDCRQNNVKEVFIGLPENEMATNSIIQNAGFGVYRKFVRTKTLSIVRKKEST
jgi:hypothetical protein